MKIITQKVQCATKSQIDFIDITDDVRDIVAHSGIANGYTVIFVEHTTMGVAINHNEPMLLQDFARMLYRLAPVDDQYAHDLFELRRGASADGRSNGHSHCKAVMIGSSEYVPVINGMIVLSDIQSIFAIDLDGPRKRDIIVQVAGL